MSRDNIDVINEDEDIIREEVRYRALCDTNASITKWRTSIINSLRQKSGLAGIPVSRKICPDVSRKFAVSTERVSG